MTVKTRFAPSPTGYLHIGGVRTALYSWLYAKHIGGDFVLRIEDTDLERSTPEHVQVILDGMNWMGLEWSEGPYYQTRRFDRYKAIIQQLLDEDKAYRCYCTKERLDKLREEQMANKQKPRYDGCCRELTEVRDEPFVVRFRTPKEGAVTFDDLVKGEITVNNSELDDLIIARTDGSPTYNFTVVIDDWDMKMTHVIRGDDHVNNTPRQINIFKALGVEPPRYAHLPMILGEDGKKLSKRHGAANVMEYREAGYLPHALLNYLVRLGWSHGDQEIFSQDEMVQHFDLTSLSRSPAALNTEKLQWLNQHYMKNDPPEEIAKELAWHLSRLDLNINNGPALEKVVIALAERTKTLLEMAEKSRYLFEDHVEYNEKAVLKHLKPESKPILDYLIEQFEALNDWEAEPIHEIVLSAGEKFAVKLGNVAQPIRVAVTGNTVSPPIDVTLELLGKERTLARLERAVVLCE